ncbi:MAG TPA: transposase [Chromatiaceae bacterium]|nr:transposase [Chromatiaceae bacterium]
MEWSPGQGGQRPGGRVRCAVPKPSRHAARQPPLPAPRSWTDNEKRCQRARIPETARQPRSKCALALELVDAAIRHKVRFGHVVVDGGYGKDPAFLRALEARSLCFVADVHKGQRIWLSDPEPTRPQARGRGRPAKKPRTDQPSQTVEQWAAQQPASAWKRISLRQGEKGALQAEYLHAYVWVWDGEEERPVAGVCWSAGNAGRRHLPTMSCPTPESRFASHAWRACRPAASSSSKPSARPRASWPWQTIRCAAGMPGTGTWHWS